MMVEDAGRPVPQSKLGISSYSLDSRVDRIMSVEVEES